MTNAASTSESPEPTVGAGLESASVESLVATLEARLTASLDEFCDRKTTEMVDRMRTELSYEALVPAEEIIDGVHQIVKRSVGELVETLGSPQIDDEMVLVVCELERAAHRLAAITTSVRDRIVGSAEACPDAAAAAD